MLKSGILALAATVFLTTQAFSHSKTEATTPAGGATVETVEMIELRFDGPMRVTAISLTGPQGDLEITRETGLDPVTAFRAIPAEAMPAGTYQVEWRGLAPDGHPVQGMFEFTVAH